MTKLVPMAASYCFHLSLDVKDLKPPSHTTAKPHLLSFVGVFVVFLIWIQAPDFTHPG